MSCRDYCEKCMRGSRTTIPGIRTRRRREGVPVRAALAAAESPEAPVRSFEGRRPAAAFDCARTLTASLPQEPEAVLPVEAVPRARPAPLASEGTA